MGPAVTQRRLLRDMAGYLPAKLLPALLPFVTLPVYTAAFDPATYGLYVLAYGAADFLMAATSTGLATGAMRFYTTYRLQGRMGQYFGALYATLATVVATAVALSVALLLVLRPLVAPDLYRLLQAAVLLFVANGWFVALMQTVRARERSRLYSALEVGARYVGAALSLTMVLALRTGPVGLFWGETIGICLAIVPMLLLNARDARPTLGADTRAAVGRSKVACCQSAGVWHAAQSCPSPPWCVSSFW